MTEQEFDKLRVLLSLKRHEQPPPGYFDNLSREIIGQIRTRKGEAPGIEERIVWEVPWLRRIWEALEMRPMAAGGLGVAVCCLLLAGVAWHTAPVTEPPPLMQVQNFGAQENGPGGQVVLSQSLPQSMPLVPAAPMLLASTGEVTSLAPTPLQRNPYAMPAMEFR